MRSNSLAPALIAAALLLACDKKPDTTTTAPVPSASLDAEAVAAASDAASGDSAPVAAVSSVTSADVTSHCPSSVAGATTTSEEAPDGVKVTIVAKDDASLADVRARAKFLAHASEAAGTYAGDDRCPVVLAGSKVVATDAPHGVVVAVSMKSGAPQDTGWLQWSTRDRVGALTSPAAVQTADCPCAAAGADTVVTTKKTAIELKVTAKDAKDTKAVGMIHDRARYVVSAAKVVGDGPKIAGFDQGASSMQGCPLVLNGEAVDAKDIPGGTLFTLTPKDPKDVSALDQEIRARLAKLAP
jgi:hypothetical protein